MLKAELERQLAEMTTLQRNTARQVERLRCELAIAKPAAHKPGRNAAANVPKFVTDYLSQLKLGQAELHARTGR